MSSGPPEDTLGIMTFIAVAVATSLALTGTTGAATNGTTSVATNPLRPYLDRIVAAGTAAAVAEVRRDGRTYRAASGRIELGRNTPATPGARFRIGSVTKAFTATVVLQLVAEGKLKLDDPLSAHLPGVVEQADTVTIKDLLGHTSGVPEHTDDLFDKWGRIAEPERTWTGQDLVDVANKHPRLFPAGTRFAYTNTNFILLGMVIEAVTGRPYTQEITERIVRPLGLTSTTTPTSSTAIRGKHLHGYVMVDGKPYDVTRINPTIAGAAGGIISTTADLDTFFRALFSGRLLRPAELKAMTTVGKGDYGLGLETAKLSCGMVYGHGGGVPGYSTVTFHSADGRRQLSLNVTAYEGDPTPAVKALVERALCLPSMEG
ncbi:serine hydrolase domain-containing protein [Nonomuraea sp. NPDC050556]|uniref:serine hydrolase domain-containing protein n=1 Tax=Nonomuraea sp. NPDC050556 TaxID=3364369 RepID=UPI0037B44587